MGKLVVGEKVWLAGWGSGITRGKVVEAWVSADGRDKQYTIESPLGEVRASEWNGLISSEDFFVVFGPVALPSYTQADVELVLESMGCMGDIPKEAACFQEEMGHKAEEAVGNAIMDVLFDLVLEWQGENNG